jgi:hypothetical protein
MLAFNTTRGFDFSRIGQIALPLGCICMNLADYPRFKSTAARMPLLVLTWVFLIFAVASLIPKTWFS